MMHRLVAFGLAVVASSPADFSLLAQSRPREANPRTRDVYVAVVDSKGVPVTGLSAADFAVREDGTTREVLKVGPATAPLQIVVLIDDSQAATEAIQRMREGLTKFVDKLAGQGRDRARDRRRTADVARAVHDRHRRAQEGHHPPLRAPRRRRYLLEGIVETARASRSATPARPTSWRSRWRRSSSATCSTIRCSKPLQASGATLHVVAIGMPSSSMSDESRNRNDVLAEGTERSGGRRDQLLAESGIPEALPRSPTTC